jgi:hypothetical protein
MKHVAPSLGLDSFSCPHPNCRAISHQSWFKLTIKGLEKKDKPERVDYDRVDLQVVSRIKDPDERKRVEGFLDRLGHNFITYRNLSYDLYSNAVMVNLSLSRCFSCDGFAVWIGDELVYPVSPTEHQIHEDTPPDVAKDVEEAASIVGKSPRGAAALLRLALQKMMPHLGEKGKNLDDDIASLVSKGLDPVIQQALDVIRVIGNNAVHPGKIDLNDNREIADKLFNVINVIVLTMITAKKQISQMFGNLPEGAKKAIEKRDGKET